ncbi:metal ABC transporter permease [Halorussus litoreus]|uniref:metal ABC transporter permease n=1 Tax=Halorussus litoreus TaxID=1710536 RepID=UPI000E26AC56|nr:metal ABC transporter permease [Halorussus litoreus]
MTRLDYLANEVGATPLALTDWLFGLLDWLLTDAYGAGMDWIAWTFGVRTLSYPYMQRAYLAVICIGIVGPLVGTFLVHREMAMIGDTLAHTAFAGVAVGLFANSVLSLSVHPLATAMVVAVGTALLVELLVEYADAHSDTSLAIVLTGGFAVGSVLITATDGGISVGIDAYLFGSLATVSKASVGLLLAMTALVAGLVGAAYRPLLYATFDETAARAARIDVPFYNRLLVVLTAAVVVSAMQILGVILVAAMLVVPVAAAARVARTFKQSLLLAVLAGEFAGVVGVTVSYRYGLAAGGSIVLTGIALYAVVLAVDAFGAKEWVPGRESAGRNPESAVEESDAAVED